MRACTNLGGQLQTRGLAGVQVEIKKFIVTLMLQSEEGLRRQLSAALALIAQSDFPAKWETLLPELAQKLASGSLDVQVRAAMRCSFSASTLQLRSACFYARALSKRKS